MSHRRWSLAALALAPVLALAACDILNKSTSPGPAPMESVPLAARALSGSVQPQDQIAALLAPAPLLIAPGEILIGAEPEVAARSQERARDVMRRLGVRGVIEVRSGGIVLVKLVASTVPRPDPARPQAIEWNETDRCPRIVGQGQLEDDIALATRCTIERLRASRVFDYVEPNYIADPGFDRLPRLFQEQPGTTGAPASASGPNDPLYALQWNFLPAGAGAGQSPGGAGFASFWAVAQTGSRDVRVAVLDTGLDLTHPEVRASRNIAAGIDMIANAQRGGDGDGVDSDAQDSGDRCGAATDDSFHGTHVAGTIGAANTNDRVGVASGAWNVTIVPVRVLGRCGGELADIASAIRWAAGAAPALGANGQQIINSTPADIINMSFTIPTRCPASMQAAIDAAVARNAVVVVAAGNKANRAQLFAPANCNNVIVVGAGDARGGLAFYSNFGRELDLIAPGGDVFSDSDGDGRPDGILSTRTTTSGCYDPVNQNSAQRCYYAFLEGTSMAAPHVSAALALLAAQTGLRGAELEQALFTRAVTPFANGFGRIACARSQNATQISAGSATCARPAGRGRLDLTRAAETLAPGSP